MLTTLRLCLVFLGMAMTTAAHAQFTAPPQAAPPSADVLFRNQCGTCHALSAKDGPRQGPPLGGVFGRKAGSVPGFKYSDGFATADFVWDEEHLGAWLTHPQAVIPGTSMNYRQGNATTRQTIITWLKEQH